MPRSTPREHGPILDAIHRKIVRLVAMHPAGRDLYLVGGTRLRLLNNSVRLSEDIDYLWEGDLAEKQAELADLLRQRLLPEVRKDLHLEGSVACATGPDADSDVVKIIELRFYDTNPDGLRLSFPLDITRVPRVDPPRTYPAEGAVVLTVSDQDLIESKIVALFSRTYYAPRDILDVYLFSHFLGPNSAERVAAKLRALVSPATIAQRLHRLQRDFDRHCHELEREIDKRVDPEPAQRLNAGGGAAMVLSRVLDTLRTLLPDRLPYPPRHTSKSRGPQR